MCGGPAIPQAMNVRWTLAACLCAVALSAAVFASRTRELAESPPLPPSSSVSDPAEIDYAGLDDARGRPAFATRYAIESDGAHRQSWDLAQAPDGTLYAANTNGVLEFDGDAWRLVQTGADVVRTVLAASDGRVYVGSSKGLGVLESDSAGFTVHREVISSDSLGGDVWGLFEMQDGIVAQTFDRLIRVENEQPVSTVTAPEGVRFHKAFAVDDRLIVRQEGAGLMEYADDALRLIPGGDAFADLAVRALLDLDGALLAVTNDELFRLAGGAAVPVLSPASSILQTGRAYHGCRLSDGPDALAAITTLGQGVVIVNARGDLVQHLGPESDLTADDLVLGCTVDRQGGLWLALSSGIVRVDAAAPLSTFGSGQGLPGAIYDIERHRGKLYVSTEHGVFRQEPGVMGRPAQFVEVAPSRDMAQAWALLTTDTGLLVGSTGGVYLVDGAQSRRIMDGPAFELTVNPAGRVLAGLKDGIAVLSPDGGWHDAGTLDGTSGEVRSLARIGDAVWGVERNGHLLRITDGAVETFGSADGVPQNVVTLQAVGGVPMLLSLEGGAFEVVPKALGGPDGIVPRPELTRIARDAAGGDGVTDAYSLAEDEAGRVWISGRKHTVALERRDGSWTDVTPAALRGVAGVLPIAVEGEVTYLGTPAGLYRLVGRGARYEIAGRALIRGLRAEDAGVLYGGAARRTDAAVAAPHGEALRFSFALPAFNDADGTMYRSELLGFDRRLGDWTDETSRTYTNLAPGHYTFRVEARTAQGAVSRASRLTVWIAPPWYLSAWAYAGYTLAVIVVISLIVAVATAAERRKTAAAQARAAELAELNAQLREADRIKDDMLANASHELRTPLTAIIGFSELLAEYPGGDPEDVRDLASHMLTGGQRLLRTVNDLLDIAQLRAGKLRLQPQSLDAAALVRRTAAELQPLADEKGLIYTVHPSDLAVPATLDPDALARVLINLISNAVKFTDAGGVAVIVDADGDHLTVAVQDSGRGIEPEFMPRLFDEYVQESTGHARAAEGSGLGLAITQAAW